MNLASDIITANSNLKINLQSRGESKVYLYAYKYNSMHSTANSVITRDSIVETLTNFDGQNHVFSLDMNDWTDCSSSKKKLFKRFSIFDSFESNESNESENDSDIIANFSILASDQQLWRSTIHHNVEVDKAGIASTVFTAELNSGTYTIGGFSVHPTYGVAVTHPKIVFITKE